MVSLEGPWEPKLVTKSIAPASKIASHSDTEPTVYGMCVGSSPETRNQLKSSTF